MRYHPHTPEDVRQMLETVGAKSLEDLFRSIPERLRLSRPLEVPAPIDEIELFAEFRRLAARNQVEHPPFLGAGAYPHHVPPTADQLLLRGEFFTDKFFALFIQLRAVIFWASFALLLGIYRREVPAWLPCLGKIAPAALFLGINTGLRVLGPLAGILVILYALYRKTSQVWLMAGIYAILAILAMYATWPYLWQDPIGHLIESVTVMARYPWEGRVLFDGTLYNSTDIPRRYLPVLLAIQLTEPVWVLFAAGLGLAVAPRSRPGGRPGHGARRLPRAAARGDLRAPAQLEYRRCMALEVVAAGAHLASAGLILPGEGNLSIRAVDGHCLITPTGVDKGRLSDAEVGGRGILLSGFPGVVKCSAADQQVVLVVPEAEEALAPAITRANEAGIRIHSVDIQEPNLETVFLQLTGRALRD